MDELRTAYEKTSLHLLHGIPFEQALGQLPWLREVLEGSARRCKPQPTTQAAKAAAR